MTNIVIKDLNMANIDDLINLCIPSDQLDDPLFIEGYKLKKKWVKQNIEKYGSIAKLAYSDSNPVGMIQYLPDISERIIRITCIFVPEKEHHRRGVGTALLEVLIDDMQKPKHYLSNKLPLALVTHTFDVPGWFSQQKFFIDGGFQKVSNKDPFILYYPFQKEFNYIPPYNNYIPQTEDAGKAIIFIDPSCPFCIRFKENIKNLIEEAIPQTPIRIINQLSEPEELEKRGKISFCVVNGKPIKSFFTEKDIFLKEVKNAFLD